MKQVLQVGVNNYNIEISDNNPERLKSDLDEYTEGKKRLFVVSKKVYALYNDVLQLPENEVLVLPDGEREKNYKNYLKIIETAYDKGFSRKDIFIALGGGVIGDITGFAAATYMRGIDYIQIPTTLLSMVDSSVGGKTAIDLPNGKNIIGAFYQPKAVFININFLKTLKHRELISGLGEVLKYAFIEESCEYSKPLFFFEYLTLCCEKFFELDSVTIIRIIDYSLKLKIAVVEKDEKESSLRKVLNFGHTLGHALEAVTKYKKFTHGEAVIYGMFFAINIAYKLGLINYSYYRMSIEFFEKYKLNDKKIYKKYSVEKILTLMKKDKKSADDKITMILPNDKKKVIEMSFTAKEMTDFLND